MRPSGHQSSNLWPSAIFFDRYMGKTKEEIVSLIRICVSSSKKRLAESEDDTTSEYLRGYIALGEFLLKEIGEEDVKSSKVTYL